MKKLKFQQHSEVQSLIGGKAFALLLLDKSTDTKIHLCDGNDWKEVPTNVDKISQLVIPRAYKTAKVQTSRKKNYGEVFTPAIVCNHQLSKHDQKWLGRGDIFFKENSDMTFKPSKANLSGFSKADLDRYISRLALEYTCGEGPYTANRCDVSSPTYQIIPLPNRCGVFDRKMIVVNAITVTVEEWIDATRRALCSTYAYDYQGDNVLLTREALILTVIDNFQYKFGRKAALSSKVLEEFAGIIAWNVFQMDGVKDTVPFSPQTQCKIKYWLSGAEILFADIHIRDN